MREGEEWIRVGTYEGGRGVGEGRYEGGRSE